LSAPAALRPTGRRGSPHSRFDTVLGRIGFDQKGDVTGYDTYVWYVWKGGEFVPLQQERRPGPD
jgi:hypothetical protein